MSMRQDESGVVFFDVDGHTDKKGIKYIGEAWQMPDGQWRCLANVGGALCIVEVSITFPVDGENKH